MGQCKREDQDFASLSTGGFKKAKEKMLKKSCKPGGKRLQEQLN
jgi:hypothetical protein